MYYVSEIAFFSDSVTCITVLLPLACNDSVTARDLLKDHPHLAWTPECEIEGHESLPTPGS
jgi:hypothetical protein